MLSWKVQVGYAMKDAINPTKEDEETALLIEKLYGKKAKKMFLEDGFISIFHAEQCMLEEVGWPLDAIGLE